MAFNKLGQAFVELALTDRNFQRQLLNSEMLFDRSVNRMATRGESRFQQFGATISGVLAGLGTARVFRAVESGIRSIVESGFQFNATMQTMGIAFTQLIGNASRAKALLGEIKRFADVTPLSFAEVNKAGVALLATKKIAETQLMPTLQKLTDIAAGSSQGFESFPRIVLAMTQMLNKGKIAAQEMGLQLANAGIPAWEALASAIGKSVRETMDLASKGKLGTDAVYKLIDTLAARSAGLAEKQSKTFSGLMSTAKDNFATFAGQITKPLFDLATESLAGLIKLWNTGGLQKFVDSVSSGVQRIADLIRSAMNSPLTMAIAKWAAVTGAVTILTAAIVGIAVVVAPIAKAILLIGTAVSAVTAGVMVLVDSFNAALSSSHGEAILNNLADIKSLVVEIGGQVASVFSSLLGKFAQLFGGEAKESAGSFWEAVTGFLRGFLENVSMLATHWQQIWEIAKTSAAIAVIDIWTQFKFLFGTQIPTVIAAMINGAVAGGKSLVSQWRVFFDQFLKELAIDLLVPIRAAAAALAKIKSGDLTASGIAGAAKNEFMKGESLKQNLRQQVGETAVKDALIDIVSAFSKTMAAMPTSERDPVAAQMEKELAGLVMKLNKSRISIREARVDERIASEVEAAKNKLAESVTAFADKASLGASSLSDFFSGLLGKPATGPTEDQLAEAAKIKKKFSDPFDFSKLQERFNTLGGLVGAGALDAGTANKALGADVGEFIKRAQEGEGKIQKSSSIIGADAIANQIQQAITGGSVQNQQLNVQRQILEQLRRNAPKKELPPLGAIGRAGGALGGIGAAIAGAGRAFGGGLAGVVGGKAKIQFGSIAGAIGEAPGLLAGLAGGIGDKFSGLLSATGLDKLSPEAKAKLADDKNAKKTADSTAAAAETLKLIQQSLAVTGYVNFGGS